MRPRTNPLHELVPSLLSNGRMMTIREMATASGYSEDSVRMCINYLHRNGEVLSIRQRDAVRYKIPEPELSTSLWTPSLTVQPRPYRARRVPHLEISRRFPGTADGASVRSGGPSRRG